MTTWCFGRAGRFECPDSRSQAAASTRPQEQQEHDGQDRRREDGSETSEAVGEDDEHHRPAAKRGPSQRQQSGPTGSRCCANAGEIEKVPPKDKDAPIAAYGGGPQRMAYHSAAKKAVALGKTNVSTSPPASASTETSCATSAPCSR